MGSNMKECKSFIVSIAFAPHEAVTIAAEFEKLLFEIERGPP
jgi:hypothetical protein